MKVYIPNCYASWLQTTPSEGQVMIIAFLAKLHSIYGINTYFEFYNDDLDIINHTSVKGSCWPEMRKLKTLGLIDQARGLDAKITVRLSDILTTGLDRRTLLTETVGYDLSLNGTMIWVYLMGRMANVDEESEIAVINKVREYVSSRHAAKYTGKEKTATNHILPIIYRDVFQKEIGQAFEGIKEFKPLINRETGIKAEDKTEYQKRYYEMRRADVLARKREWYQQKKNKENGID